MSDCFQCIAITKSGKNCKIRPKEGDLCHIHKNNVVNSPRKNRVITICRDQSILRLDVFYKLFEQCCRNRDLECIKDMLINIVNLDYVDKYKLLDMTSNRQILEMIETVF